MRINVIIAAFIALLTTSVAPAFTQQNSLAVATNGTRVAVLPFADYAEEPAALMQVMRLVRDDLKQRSADVVTADATMDVLRRYRIRTTNELSVDQMQKLSADLDAAFLLVGSLDRYVASGEGAEVALSARLIHVPTTEIAWTASADVHTQDGIRPLDIGTIRDAAQVTQRAVDELFTDFCYRRPEHIARVAAVRLHGNGNERTLPCQSLAVLPFANETSLHFAGSILSQRMLPALADAGFDVVDPGRVREVMLDEGDVTPGKATTSLLKLCQEQISADLILTGTVSHLIGADVTSFDTPVELEVEARLIDPRTGDVVWAKTLRVGSDDGHLLFGTGTMHGVGSVMDHLAAKLAHSIPVRRVRGA